MASTVSMLHANPPPGTPAIVLPGGANSLAVIWGLVDAGVPVIALVHDGDCPHRWSRFPVRRIGIRSGAAADLLDGLARLADEGGVIIPTADRHVAMLSEQEAHLREQFRLILPRPELVATLLDKRAEIPLMGELGIATPRSVAVLPTTPEEIVAAVGLPLIVKPRSFAHGSRLSFKTLVIRDQASLASFYAQNQARLDSLVAQEVVPGTDSDLWKCDCTFNLRSELVNGFTFQKIRMAPAHFGVSSLAISRSHPAVLDLVAGIGRKLGYTGPMNIEFKYDARDGQFKYIEINPRLGMCNYFDAVCGVNNAWYAYRLAMGEDLQPETPGQRDGVLYCSVLSDIATRIGDGEKPAQIARHYFRLRRHDRVGAYFRWRDPLPGLAHTTTWTVARARGALRRVSRWIQRP